MDEGHKLWYSEEDARHEHDADFLVHRKVARAIRVHISSRLISKHVFARPHHFPIVQVYAPTSMDEDNKVEEFYQLQLFSVTGMPRSSKAPTSNGQELWVILLSYS